MRRLSPLNKTLLLTLVPLWAICVVLCIKSAVYRTGFSPVYVTAPVDAKGYPSLAGFKDWLDGEQSGLRVGDRLLRVGDSDLQAVGSLGFWVRLTHEAGSARVVPVVFERAGIRAEALLPVSPLATYIRPLLPVSLVFGLAGTFLLLRARPSPMVRALAQAFLCLAIAWASYFGGGWLETYASITVHVLFFTLAYPLCVRAFILFPNDYVPERTWQRVAPWLFLPLGALEASTVYGFPFRAEVGIAAYYASVAAVIALAVAIGTRNYRHADPIGRRQLKWAVLGLYGAALPPIVGYALAAADPRFTPLALHSLLAMGLFPVSLVIAVTRYNLWDVDRIISATATYNLLLVVVIAGGLVLVPPAAQAASTWMNIDPAAGQAMLSLVLAALVVPASRRVRPRLDRIFFPERYAVDSGIGQLLRDLAACQDPQSLTRVTADRLHRLFRPENCVVYAQSGNTYVPIFVEGRAVPPAFEQASSLAVALERRRGPLVLADATTRPSESPLSPFDRAALDTFEARVVLPVWHRAALWAFVCLGAKSSGDVYTPTDLSLLLAVTEKVSDELRRFEDADVIRESRAMQASLRRYVPGVVADQLTAGTELTAGERDLSVLFVDIRGYTTYSESRAAEEVFSTVNRYTAAVSRIVNQHGGSVVEFHGDGLLAVFGAPIELHEKEQAAVAAGREIVSTVEGLETDVEAGDPIPLSVGVGIATGPAFVGNIQSTDRAIWTAIGDTVNTAARLEALTRDLAASVIIDEGTWRALGNAGHDFEKRAQTAIRGRTRSLDLYVLPLRTAT